MPTAVSHGLAKSPKIRRGGKYSRRTGDLPDQLVGDVGALDGHGDGYAGFEKNIIVNRLLDVAGDVLCDGIPPTRRLAKQAALGIVPALMPECLNAWMLFLI
jgi:hypothetical protein